jgi:hypothetical protein
MSKQGSCGECAMLSGFLDCVHGYMILTYMIHGLPTDKALNCMLLPE